jgi:hypothetical protein
MGPISLGRSAHARGRMVTGALAASAGHRGVGQTLMNVIMEYLSDRTFAHGLGSRRLNQPDARQFHHVADIVVGEITAAAERQHGAMRSRNCARFSYGTCAAAAITDFNCASLSEIMMTGSRRVSDPTDSPIRCSPGFRRHPLQRCPHIPDTALLARWNTASDRAADRCLRAFVHREQAQRPRRRA